MRSATGATFTPFRVKAAISVRVALVVVHAVGPSDAEDQGLPVGEPRVLRGTVIAHGATPGHWLSIAFDVGVGGYPNRTVNQDMSVQP